MRRNKSIITKVMKDVTLAEKLRKSFHFTVMGKKKRIRKKNKAILTKLYSENWYTFAISNYLYTLMTNNKKINRKMGFIGIDHPSVTEEIHISFIPKDLPKPAKLDYEFEKRKRVMLNEKSLWESQKVFQNK